MTILYITFFLFYWSDYFGGNLLSLLLLFGAYSLWRSYLKQPYFLRQSLYWNSYLEFGNIWPDRIWSCRPLHLMWGLFFTTLFTIRISYEEYKESIAQIYFSVSFNTTEEETLLHVWRPRRFLHLFARWNLFTCGNPRLIIRRFWYVTDTCTSFRDCTLFTCAFPEDWIVNVNNEIFLHVCWSLSSCELVTIVNYHR